MSTGCEQFYSELLERKVRAGKVYRRQGKRVWLVNSAGCICHNFIVPANYTVPGLGVWVVFDNELLVYHQDFFFHKLHRPTAATFVMRVLTAIPPVAWGVGLVLTGGALYFYLSNLLVPY